MREKERSKVEIEKLQGYVTNYEKQQSEQKEECVDLKEKLNRAILNKEVLEQEKLHLNDTIRRSQEHKEAVENESKPIFFFSFDPFLD